MKRLAFVAFCLLVGGCKTIPEDRYGITRLRFEGAEHIDARALATCLASHERTRVGITLGLPGSPSCGEPPFDARYAELRLWTWPWTEWPLFDQSLFDQDLDRVIRWYRARGYPNARVVETRITPAAARDSDLVEEDTACERDDGDEGCRVRITIVIDEGDPIRVTTVRVLHGEGQVIDPDLAEELEDAVDLDPEERFDEYAYELGKTQLLGVLADRGHCHAVVEGSVRILRAALTAEVDYRVTAGPVCRVGEVTVEGEVDLPVGPIRRASKLRTGTLYDASDILDAQQAVFALGAFSTVEVEADVVAGVNVVPIVIRVTPAQRNRFMLGGGVQTGQALSTTDGDAQLVNQWDLHVLAGWENRNLFGGMRRLSLEDRVRLISNEQFPRFSSFAANQNLGNVLTLEFEQPAFIEARTSLKITGLYDVGPDPYAAFFRHAIRAGVDLERAFWERRIRISAGIHIASYMVPGSPMSASDAQQDWLVTYWQQTLELDLRDQPVRTRQGLYLSLRLQEAGFGLPSNWSYLRILPEIRAYAPLPAGIVLAGRFRIGAIFGRENFGDAISADNPLRMGPDIHRFRGGGPVSNRGFLAQRLGDGEAGGTRLWEANLELRVPISQNLWLATFADMGDASREERFRFNYLQLSVGGGVRYYTIVGPIRVDVGFRVPGAQVLGGGDQRELGYCTEPDTLVVVDCAGSSHRGRLFGGPGGAIHITLGDAF
ncbi:MAG: BamA/TamA family outer membrane protein [Sandaracinaceae bacterium]|nr:BamA/TamA family outer membrane protein [Sandaracinaceae bacterium]